MQTTIQEQSSIRKGSVRVLIGESFASLVDIGALRNPALKSLAENQSIAFDNVADLKKFVKGKRVQFTFDLAEINFDNLAVLDDGIMNLSTQASSPVAITNEAHGTGWTLGQPIALTHKNGDNTSVGSIVVKAGGSSITLNTDYRVYVGDGSNGELGTTYIVPVTAQTLAITVNYSYTPNASKTLTFNDAGTKALKCMRITNVDENGKSFKIDIENGTNFAPTSITFASDIKDDVAILPVDFQGDLVEIVDEQNA